MDISHYRTLRERAALVDRTDRGRLLLTGRDRASYLQGLLTNDITALGPGAGCYAAYLTPQGRMIADMRVFELGDGLLIVLAPHVRDLVRDRFGQLIFSEDVQVTDLTGTWTGFGLYGPSAARVLAAAVAGPASVVGPDVSSAAAGFAAWAPFRSARVRIGDAPVVVAASDEIGVAGFDIFVERAHAEAVRARLVTAGAAEVDAAAADVVRVESGVPEFGVDMDDDTIPLEAGLEHRAISFTKGCYVGQEVIVRVRDRGHGRVARRLVGVRLEGDEAPARGAAMLAGDREIGRVTSAVRSPALDRPIALGYLHRDFVEPGTRVTVARGDQRLDGIVAALPFVPIA